VTPHRATPEQWVNLERRQLGGNDLVCAALELRARVEALEDAAQNHIIETSANILALASRVESLEAAERQASKVYEINEPLQLTPEQAQQIRDLLAPNSKPTPNPGQIRSSLVERVAIAISRCEDSFCWDHEAVSWEPEARAAIREVAAWLRSQDLSICDYWAGRLEQEAKQ
jgi:hypothetical protein